MIRATVKTRGRQSERWFPDHTSARVVQEWKDRERARLLDATQKPSAGTFQRDVDRFLDTLPPGSPLKKERTRQLAWWIKRFGTRRRSDIDATMIRTALVELRQQRAASTCNHYRDALAAMWTVLDGKDKPSPLRDVPKFQEPEAEPRNLPVHLVERILETMVDLGARAKKGHRRSRVSLTKLRYRVMYATGLSPAEIMRLRPEHLHLADRAVYVQRRQKGKGVEGMMMPLLPAGVVALEQFALANAFGRFSTHGARKAWVTACVKLREHPDTSEADRRLLRRARPYDLRHTYATQILHGTQNLQATKELMRHRSVKTTKRYARAAVPAHLRAALDLVMPIAVDKT